MSYSKEIRSATLGAKCSREKTSWESWWHSGSWCGALKSSQVAVQTHCLPCVAGNGELVQRHRVCRGCFKLGPQDTGFYIAHVQPWSWDFFSPLHIESGGSHMSQTLRHPHVLSTGALPGSTSERTVTNANHASSKKSPVVWVRT